MKKRILAILMALCMVMTVMPTALAEGGDEATGTTCEGGADCEHEAAIGTAHYDTLAAAIGEAEDGDTVELLKNVTAGSDGTDGTDAANFWITKSITLDLDGYTLTGGYQIALGLKSDVSVIVKDGTIEEGSLYAVYATAGDLTLENVSISTDSAFGIAVLNNSTVTVDADTVVASKSDVPIFVQGKKGETSGGPTLNVYGKVAAEAIQAISTNGQDYSQPTINIYDGASVTSEQATAMYIPNVGEVNIYGGTITGVSSAIGMKCGTLNIMGGTLTATGPDSTPTEGFSNGIYASGAAIQIESNDGYKLASNTPGTVTVNITGGSIVSENGYAIYEYVGVEAKTGKPLATDTHLTQLSISEDDDAVIVTGEKGALLISEELAEAADDGDVITISGGSYSHSVAEYVDSSIPVELNNNGTYTYHETVEDALAAADEGAVITDTTDPDAEPITVVTVTFEGAKEKPITVLPGTEIELPTPDDTRDEIFRYWTVEGDPIGTRYYGGETVEITEDITFVANWKDNSYIPIPPTQPTKPTKPAEPDEPDEPDEPEEPVESELPFTDVDVDDTFYEAVKYVSENGLMTGTATDTFAPYGAFTRAQVATILYRLEKEPAVAFAATFPDVQENQWFASAVLWGNSKGILLGHDTGKFGPDDGVTFEQMLTILYRYAALKGYDTAARADVAGFECSDYAAEAVSWAMAHGMVSAADGAALKAPAARCQVAQVLAVFCQTVVIK